MRLSPVTEQEIVARLDRAGTARAAALADVTRAPSPSRLVPEDLTRRPHVFHVAVYDYTDAAIAETVARVGQLEGFSVVARLAPDSEWAGPLSHVPGLVPVEVPESQYIWTEATAEIALDGTVSMTVRVGDQGLIGRSLLVDRVRRFYPEVPPAELEELSELPDMPDGPPGALPLPVMRRFRDIMFMMQGFPEKEGGQEAAAVVAAVRGAPLREELTYLEGGNVLLGTLPGGEPYALVGGDSAAVSRALLERHHARPVSEAEVIAAMANDLGVAPARLFLVEQPWVVHLDMAMALLAPGVVVLNDALEAFRLQTRWLREDYEAWRPGRETSGSDASRAKSCTPAPGSPAAEARRPGSRLAVYFFFARSATSSPASFHALKPPSRA